MHIMQLGYSIYSHGNFATNLDLLGMWVFLAVDVAIFIPISVVLKIVVPKHTIKRSISAINIVTKMAGLALAAILILKEAPSIDIPCDHLHGPGKSQGSALQDYIKFDNVRPWTLSFAIVAGTMMVPLPLMVYYPVPAKRLRASIGIAHN